MLSSGKRLISKTALEVASMSNEYSAGHSTERVVVSISLGEARAEFSGSPEVVLQSVNNFISKQIPEIDLARKLSLNYSTKDLVEKFKDYVKITPEGPRIWNQERKMSDKELVVLQLAAQRIASETRENVSTSTTLVQLQERTGLNPKSLSSRLSEMTKAGFVQRETTEDNKTQFRITTIGVEWLGTLLEKK
jgi:predicted transcriptional regulator